MRGLGIPYVVRDDDVVSAAIVLMLQHEISSLLDVHSAGGGRFVGYVDRSSILDARLRWYEEEPIRRQARQPADRARDGALKDRPGQSRYFGS